MNEADFKRSEKLNLSLVKMEFDPETKKIAIIVPLLFNLKYTLKISDAETRIKLLSKEIQSITAAESYDENVAILPS